MYSFLSLEKSISGAYLTRCNRTSSAIWFHNDRIAHKRMNKFFDGRISWNKNRSGDIDTEFFNKKICPVLIDAK
jgi:hypothetical protein